MVILLEHCKNYLETQMTKYKTNVELRPQLK